MIATWRLLAEATVAAHYAFMAYLVVGGFVAWHWRRTMLAHLASAVWATLIVVADLDCPLTALQNFFRDRAGQVPLRGGFIDVYLRGTFYPAHQQAVAQGVLAAVVAVSWIGYVIRGRRAPRLALGAVPAHRARTGPHSSYSDPTAPRS